MCVLCNCAWRLFASSVTDNRYKVVYTGIIPLLITFSSGLITPMKSIPGNLPHCWRGCAIALHQLEVRGHVENSVVNYVVAVLGLKE